MIVAINYADEKFRKAQKLNSQQALKKGVDRVIEYGPEDIDDDFRLECQKILDKSRGNGYWLWKPYFIMKTLKEIEDNDILIYTDSGSVFMRNIRYLIHSMDMAKTDIMCFVIEHMEKKYTKRDAFILLDCDKQEYTDTQQICGGYIIVRKSENSIRVIQQYLDYAKDERIITDMPNVLGKDNYPEFVDHRHDQSIWSLVCKKNNVKPFRDPSEWGMDRKKFSKEINKRSVYPQMIESHRNGELTNYRILQKQYLKRLKDRICDLFYRWY